MEILVLIMKFSQALKTYQTLKKFILGGEMAIILQQVGDAHMRAAARALSDKELSQTPEREVESAITSLRSAYESHQEGQKKYQASAAIALCYRFLNEKELTVKYLDLCKEHFEDDKNNRIYQAKYYRGLTDDSYRDAKIGYLIYGLFSPIERVLKKN